MSRNYQLQLVAVVVVFPLVFMLPILLLSTLPLTTVLVSLLKLLVTVFSVAALSLAYREIDRLERTTA